MNHSTGKPTKADLRRFDKLHELGCICCGSMVTEIHHFTLGNRRIGHHATIPLCPQCHTGTAFSWHKTRRAFRERMGTDAELLARVNSLIGEIT